LSEFNTVIDYLVEQADRNDVKNLQYERDILFKVKREEDKLHDGVMRCIYTDIDTVLHMQSLMNGISSVFKSFNHNVRMVLNNEFGKYHDTAYKQMDELLEIGKTMSDKLNEPKPVKEMKMIYGDRSIDFIRKHALDMTDAYTQSKVEQIRAAMADMMLNGRGSKAQIRTKIEKILGVDRSKAEEIAQTELSRAYNYGEMERLDDYARENPTQRVRKYWHGFAESKITCGFCRDHIGEVVDYDDNSQPLPAHPRCRCIWLPLLDGWDKPVSKEITRRANMLKQVYTPDQIYSRINSRLHIPYGRYIDQQVATDYLSGDRSENTMNSINNARNNAVSDVIDSFGITKDTSNNRLSDEFNIQMNFWKNLVAGAAVDNDNDLLDRSYEAIKGVMLLPWNSEQLSKWNSLLSHIK
jgi:hypothetical protein